MNNYPHTIDNGRGERLTFRRRIRGATGERLEGDNIVQPQVDVPMHVHYFQEEAFTVQQGKLGYQRLGEAEQYAGAGETVVFQRGVGHRFWNAGEEELHCTVYAEPADNIEYFLSAVFAAQKQNGGQQPNLFDAAYLLTRYRSEYRMLVIPDRVQRLVFPFVLMLGQLLGKYRKYADAPEPLTRPTQPAVLLRAAPTDHE